MLKPGRWSVDPGAVDERYQDLWQHLTWAIPVWENDAEPVAYPSRTLATANNATWEPTIRGIGLFTDADNDEYPEWAADSRHDMAPIEATSGDVRFSCFFAYIETSSNGAQFPVLGGQYNSAAAGAWYVHRENSVGPALTFYPTASSSIVYKSGASGSDWPGTGYHTMGFAREPGGTWFIYLDGVLWATSTTATGNLPTANEAHIFTLGELSDDSGAALETSHLAAYVWQGRTLTETDAYRLHNDPFGPFRPSTAIPAAPQVTIELSATITATATASDGVEQTNQLSIVPP